MVRGRKRHKPDSRPRRGREPGNGEALNAAPRALLGREDGMRERERDRHAHDRSIEDPLGDWPEDR